MTSYDDDVTSMSSVVDSCTSNDDERYRECYFLRYKYCQLTTDLFINKYNVQLKRPMNLNCSSMKSAATHVDVPSMTLTTSTDLWRQRRTSAYRERRYRDTQNSSPNHVVDRLEASATVAQSPWIQHVM